MPKPTTHMADCRVTYCPGCVAPDVADLGAETRAALVATGHRITPKVFELDLPNPTREEDR